MVSSLDIQVEAVQESSNCVVDILGSTGSSRVALPLNECVLEFPRVLWQMPSSLPPTAKITEWKYYIPAWEYEHFTHKSPKILRGPSGEREVVEKKLYSRATVSYLEPAGLWSRCSRLNFVDKSVEDVRQAFQAVVDEGKLAVRSSHQTALDVADSAAGTVASAITIQRCSWFQLPGLPQDVQHI